MKRLLILIATLLLFISALSFIYEKYPSVFNPSPITTPGKIEVLREESVVTQAVKNVGPSVVTIVETVTRETPRSFQFGPFSIFELPEESAPEPTSQNIGSGFITSSDGTLVTNKHVVSDLAATYQIITSDDKTYKVISISRDPLNDVAILKVDPKEHPEKMLKPVVLGDSEGLEVGQFVIAIGTALGEFRNTVTTGVISGLGRGITAGSDFEGYVEKLDNVIQTDAAINPGNSGGPLLNSSSQVIGVNTAIAASGQNIGFALPINVVKSSLENFSKNGKFVRPYLGVAYQTLSREAARLNNLAEGAYIQRVVPESPAEEAGLNVGDVVLKIDGKELKIGKFELASVIASKKVGDKVKIIYSRNGKIQEIQATLTSAPNQ